MYIKTEDPSYACSKLDPYYNIQVKAIDIVKDFIKERHLCLYGGTALDFAARLAGSKIYDDTKLEVPDLDFFSDDPVRDARDLAEKLYDTGMEKARAIGAYHVGTMRADPGGNHFVADISYCGGTEILKSFTVMNYQGMNILHPMYQRVDMHSSLAFPYDNAPMESIFNRWKKDIERFMIMDKLYPVSKLPAIISASKADTNIHKINISDLHISNEFIYTGHVGWAIINGKQEVYSDIIEIVSMEPIKTVTALGKLIAEYHRFLGILPHMYFVQSESGQKYIVYSTQHRLVSIVTRDNPVAANKSGSNHITGDMDNSGSRIMVTCANYIAMITLGHLIKLHMSENENWKSFSAFPWTIGRKLLHDQYIELMTMPIDLSVRVYGDDNIDHNELIRLEQQEVLLGDRPAGVSWKLPDNYNVAKGREKRKALPEGTVEFDYMSNEFFILDGSKCEENA